MMTPLAEIGLPAYGLQVNPFAIVTLNPLANQADLECVSLVDGWKDLDGAKRHIRQRVAADKPVFFVVAGASNTGRTSVAYYLVHLWAQARGVPSDVVVAERSDPGPDGGDFSPEAQLTDWAQGLLFREDINQLGLTPGTRTRLEDLAESVGLVKFGLALRGVDVELRTPKAGQARYLAAILEHGKGDDLVRQVKGCFKGTRAIVIITVDESAATKTLLKNAGQVLSPDDGLYIRLGPILGADVATIIQDRWEAVSKGVKNPFDLTAAAQVFDSPRTIARTMHLLKRMLYLRDLLHDDPAAPWPVSRNLALSGDVMRGLLADFESQLPAGLEA